MQIGLINAGIALNGGSTESDPGKIADAARQLETQFAKLMISSMRTTSLGDSMFPGGSEHYRDMYDQKLADSLTRGKGLGLQSMIRQQLAGSPQNVREQFESAGKMYPMDGYKRLQPLHKGVAPTPLPPADGLPLPASTATQAPESMLQAFDRVARAIAAATAPAAAPGPLPANASSELEDCSGQPKAAPRPGSPEAFVAQIWPHAQRAAAELGVCPKALVAQAALETGWGRHPVRGKSGDANNLFGIKAGGRWQGAATTQPTREYVNGVATRQNAAFRAYQSVADSFSDYVALLKNTPRYAAALGQSTTRAFAGALQRAGYATDPQYAAKLTAIAEGPTLNRALAGLDEPRA